MVTPHELYPSLSAALAVPAIFFKREDLHPYGSHKGRSIPVMIDFYRAQGARDFVISSSGNAALAAALHIALLNSSGKSTDTATHTPTAEPLSLTIFIGKDIDPKKEAFLAEIKDPKIKVVQVERPLQSMTQLAQQGATPLRQSTDDSALVGYQTLADELCTIPALEAVFIAASSGTTAQALATALIPDGVQIHIAQTTSCHPIADHWKGKSETSATDKGVPEIKSIAGAIVDKIGHRKEAVVAGVKESSGACWIITNTEIEAAQKMVAETTSLQISANSALAVAALMKALDEGAVFEGSVACIICGH